MLVEYELAISYPTSASGIIILLKTPTKYREFFLTLFNLLNNRFSAWFLYFEQTSTATIFEEHGIINNYSPKAKLILLNNPGDEVEGIIQQY